jgi:phage/plasmid-like protein (TIGR03299 family)
MEINQFGHLVDTHNSLVSAKATAHMLDSFGLNWVVEKQPLLLPSGNESGYFGIVRKDTEKVFTTASGQYEVFQNDELAELVQEVAQTLGSNIARGGLFNEGGKVYLQIPMEDKVIGTDVVKRYATAINSHDGTTALRWGASSITISCRNSFNAAAKDLKDSVRHTANMRRAVEESLRAIQGINDADATLYEVFRRMADKQVRQQDVQRVVDAVVGVDILKSAKSARDEYSTRRLNQAQDLSVSISKEMSYKGDNLWGLFSGVTHYTTHKAGRENSRDVSKMTGSLQKTDQRAFNILAELV